MEGYPRRALLVLSIAVAATALPPPGREAVSYDEAVALGVDVFNQESGEAFAFRLLEARPQPEWDPRSQQTQVVQFTVHESTCPASEWLSPETCDFKEDGVVKECSGTFFAQDRAPEIHCKTPRLEHIRVRRNVFNRSVKNIKKKLKCFRLGCHSLIGHVGSRHGLGGRRWALAEDRDGARRGRPH